MSKLRFSVLFLMTTFLVQAAPPLDVTQSGPDALRSSEKKSKPKDSDFEMLDVNDPQPDFEKESVEILFDVMGRAKPGRDGRPILRCIKFDRVRFLKLSVDKKWAAIQSFRSGKKAWIPIQSIDRIPTKKN